MLKTVSQIPFDLGYRTAHGRDDFLVAPSNQDAVAWLDLWPEWPAPCLVIHGEVASGKSHLCSVWGEKSNAACINPATLSPHCVQDIAASANHLILDNADDVIGNAQAERALFHLYNIFKEEQRSFLLVLRDAPVRKNFVVADLASRLRAAPAVAIREPDDQLLSAVLVKLFNDRQLRIGADVLRYILPRMERSFEAARTLVHRADRQALIEKRPISIPLLRGVLRVYEEESAHITTQVAE